MDSVTTRSRQKGFIDDDDDDSHNNRNDDDLLYLNHNNNNNNNNNNSNDDGIEVDLHGISISEESRLQQQSHSHSVTKQRKSAKKLDEYGFIVNIDEKGTIRSEDSFYLSGGATTPSLLTNSITSIHKSKNNHNDNTNNNHMIKQRRSGSRKRNNANSLTSYFPILRSSLDPNHLKSSSPKHRGSRNKNNHNNNDDDKGDNDDNDDKKHNNNHHHQYQRQRHTKQPATSTIKVSPSRNNKNRERKIKERLTLRREQKWNQMIHDYNNIVSSKPKRKKLYSRIRKGIPNSIRGQAWVTMAKVNIQVENNKGVYADLVEQSCNDKLEGIQQALLPLIAREEHENQYEREHDHQHDFHCSNGSHTSQNYHQDYDSDENREYHHANAVAAAADPTADIMKETIERDINRTFPRHSMFYDSYSDSDDDDDDDHAEKYEKSKEKSFHDNINRSNSDELSDESYDKISLSESLGSTGHGERIESIGVNMPENLLEGDLCEDEDGNEVQHEYSDSSHGEKNHDICCTEPVRAFTDADLCGDGKKEYELVLPSPPPPTTTTTLLSTVNTPLRKEKKKVDFATEEGGQASLRRVLRAYSLYDPEVGYCQGMNFIAGMFITFVSEEEAFWLLVYVMNATPCRMRGLFGVGMSEAHQVLYVAEKLIAQFNPKLSKHLYKENIHITMFATQWLLTMFTSSFPFHIVTRVWDCFILEGWKVAYRVMLALLEKATPELLKLKFEEILNHFKVLPFQVDANSLFAAAFNIPLKKKHIEKYAKQWLRRQELEKYEKQRQSESTSR